MSFLLCQLRAWTDLVLLEKEIMKLCETCFCRRKCNTVYTKQAEKLPGGGFDGATGKLTYALKTLEELIKNKMVIDGEPSNRISIRHCVTLSLTNIDL